MADLVAACCRKEAAGAFDPDRPEGKRAPEQAYRMEVAEASGRDRAAAVGDTTTFAFGRGLRRRWQAKWAGCHQQAVRSFVALLG